MAKEPRFPMTMKGKDKLNEELAYLTVEKRQEVLNRIKRARTFCDFNEDSEYEEALKEQVSVENRILLVKKMIEYAEIILRSLYEVGAKQLF